MLKHPDVHAGSFQNSLANTIYVAAQNGAKSVVIALKSGTTFEITGAPNIGRDFIRFETPDEPGNFITVPLENIAYIKG